MSSVAALTAECDREIRKATLNTLATAYKNLGKLFPFLFSVVDFSCSIRTIFCVLLDQLLEALSGLAILQT